MLLETEVHEKNPVRRTKCISMMIIYVYIKKDIDCGVSRLNVYLQKLSSMFTLPIDPILPQPYFSKKSVNAFIIPIPSI